MINVSQPCVGDEELAAVGEVFASNWLGHGRRTTEFEAAFAGHLGVAAEQVIFLNSATAGLFLAAELLGLGPGDDVVLPSVSFVAGPNAVASTGARPVFCDVDPRTLNPTVADVESALTPRTRAVMVLHYGGYPGEISGIAGLCRDRGIALIEDAACSVASSVHGTRCGVLGDIGVWSFDSRKLITTGDGGMIYLRDPALARRAYRLAYHGLEDRSAFITAGRAARQWWALEVQDVGRRLIGNDITAAIGHVQLRRMPGFVARRRAIAGTYDRLLAEAEGIRVPPPLPAGHVTSYYFYWVQLAAGVRDQVMEDLFKRGVYTSFRYAPLHEVPLYRAGRHLPGTDEASATTLLLPVHPALDDADVRTVVDELRKSIG
jgi:dTDP-4-dehydro-2,3,6-trideoxy-D-glucose 4-aminotransferase